jgi:hypothetical protein
MRTIAALLLATVALLVAAAQAGAAPCVPKTNLEAIVDDSGSMFWNDPNDLRVAALQLLMDTQGNEKRTLGAVEFGSEAAPLFGPGPIGANAGAYKLALTPALVEDGGGTDYNEAFAAAAAHNPNANARIFLTDGEHTDDVYANGHVGGPPVYVIGLSAIEGSPYDLLLQRIASETGGLYRRAADAGALQAAMFDVNSAIACQTPPKQFNDAFSKLGQSEAHTVKVPSRIKTAQFALTWANAQDRFTITGLRVIRKGKLVARTARVKVRRLKVSRRQGATFTTVRVSGLVPGKLRFVVKPTRLASPGTEVNLTTQVTRRAR